MQKYKNYNGSRGIRAMLGCRREEEFVGEVWETNVKGFFKGVGEVR